MRKYHDTFYWSIELPVRLDISTAAREAKQRIAQLYREAHWRLNELEAIVHADFFAARWQSILPNYGERRCIGGDDIAYWHRWSSDTPWSIHHGRPNNKFK